MVVLGLDAAWTAHHASGVSVLVGEGAVWRCAAAVSSIEELTARGGCEGLIPAAEAIAGAPITLACVDMPLATAPITARRACDSQVSREFGGRGCSVHSPSADRPGAVSTELMTALAGVGFQLAVHGKAVPGRQVIEVYPHIAVMRLLGEDYRVPYKIGRARRYWKERSREECRKLIHEYLGQILGALREHIQEIDLQLPPATARQADLKRFEDALDGVVCAWVGTLHLSGETESFGDQTAAIWVPRDRRLQPTAGKSEFGQTLSGTT